MLANASWEQIVSQHPNAHPLQSAVWGNFKSRWGWTAVPTQLTFGGDGDNRSPAAALILKRKVPRLPFSILYVPKGPTLNYSDGPLRRAVLAELERIAHAEKAILIKIDPEVVVSWGLDPERKSPLGAKFVQELQNRGWRYSNEQIQFKNTVEMDLTQSEENLLRAMKSKTRYNIRLAGRKGITIRDGSPADFPLIAEMYRETAVRDGFGIRPSAYYLDVWQSFYDGGMGQALIAEYEGEPIAAVFLVKQADRAIYMYGASTGKERNRMPNYLLQWEAIRWSKAQGCKIYDFWGAPTEFLETDPLWGVWRFKKGFNAQVVRHIGAWDYAARPLWYNVYTKILPKYTEFLQRRNN